MRLAGADDRPLDVAHRLPPPDPLHRGRLAPGRLVGGEQLVQRSHTGDGEIVVAEPPRADAQPADVLGRIARMAQLPVDDRRKAGLVDDQVAEPEVAVDETSRGGGGGGLRRSQRSPTSTAGSGSPISSSVGLPQRAGGERRVAIRGGDAVDGPGVDRVDPGQRLPKLGRQRARGRTPAPRAAARAAPPTSPRRGPSRSRRSPNRPPAGSNASRLATGTPAAAAAWTTRNSGSSGANESCAPTGSRRSTQRPRVGLGEERLPGRAPGNGRQPQRAWIRARALGDQLADAGTERVFSRRRHDRARTAPSGGPGCPPGPCTSTRCTDPGRSPRAGPTDRPDSRSTGSEASRS